MSEWKKYTLYNIVDIIGGGTPKRSIKEYWNGDIPWLSVADFNNDDKHVSITQESITKKGLENSSTKILERGQIIISARGTVGALAQVDKPMAFNQSCYGLNAKNEYTTNDFLYYLLKLKISNLQKITHGAVFDTITRDTFKQIEVNLPPLQIQKKIARILSTLDKKIELNRKMNATLESMAQAIFKSWFVDFEPVLAKAKCKSEAELEDAAKELGISKEVLALFPSEFDESELGRVPKGWEWQSLGDLCTTITKGTTPKKSDIQNAENEKNIPFIKVKDITKTGEISRNSLEKIPYSVHIGVLKRSILKVNDLLFSIAGTIGRVAIVDGDLDNTNTNQAIGIIRLKNKSSYLNLVWLALQSKNVQNDIKAKVIQGVQANTSLTNLRNITILLPSEKVLKCWNDITGELLNKLRTNQIQAITFQKTRDTLLPKLLSGELNVSKVEEC